MNLVITMVIGGLWHGANWNFVIWGALHGFGLAFVRLWQAQSGTAKAEAGPSSAFWRYASIILTFHYVTFAWIFFRAPSFDVALAILGRIASLTVSFANISGPLALVLVIGVLAHYVPKKWYDWSLTLYMYELRSMRRRGCSRCWCWACKTWSRAAPRRSFTPNSDATRYSS